MEHNRPTPAPRRSKQNTPLIDGQQRVQQSTLGNSTNYDLYVSQHDQTEHTYEVKRIGKYWVIRSNGQKFQRLPVPDNVSVEVCDQFLLVDENLYEIIENGQGQITLCNVEDVTVTFKSRETDENETNNHMGINADVSGEATKRFPITILNEDQSTPADTTAPECHPCTDVPDSDDTIQIESRFRHQSIILNSDNGLSQTVTDEDSALSPKGNNGCLEHTAIPASIDRLSIEENVYDSTNSESSSDDDIEKGHTEETYDSLEEGGNTEETRTIETKTAKVLKKEDKNKGSFRVSIQIIVENENIEKQIYLENVECYLKYQFVLKNETYFVEAVGQIRNSLFYEVKKDNGLIYLDMGIERFTEQDYIKCITDFADRCNIVVNKWPLSGVDEKNVLLGLENEAKNTTLHCLTFRNHLFVAYDEKNAQEVAKIVTTCLNEHSLARQTCHRELKIPYIFSILLDKKEVDRKYGNNIAITWTVSAENDEVCVNFEGKKTDVLEAMANFYKDIYKSCCFARFSYASFESLDVVPSTSELLHSYLKKTSDMDTDIQFAINETKKSFWCFSDTSQANADKALQEVKSAVEAKQKNKNDVHYAEKSGKHTHSIEKTEAVVKTSGKNGHNSVKDSETLPQGCNDNENRLSQELTLSVSNCDSEAAVRKAVEQTQKKHEGNVDIKYEVCKGPSNSPQPVPEMEKCLEDYRYMKWKLDSNTTLYCVEKIIELPGSDLVIVPMESAQKVNQTGQHKSGNICFIQIPDKDAPKAKDTIYNEVQESLNKLQKKKSYQLDVQVVPMKAWDKYRYIKPVYHELRKLVQKEQFNYETEAVIVMLCSDSDAFITLSDILIEAVGVQVDVRKPLSKHHYQGDFKVVVERGEITIVKADVIVNPVGSDLNLNKGDVSRSIFGSAGKDLQDELRKIKPEGIIFGDSIVTESFLMKNCNYIVHGALDFYKGQGGLQKMEDLVLKCFEKANQKRCFSIAMPTIGLGNLNYSKEDVAEVMFGAVRRYYRDQHPSYLRCVKFVVFHKNKDVFKEFQKHEKRWREFMEHQKASVIYSGIRLQFEHGSIARPGTDAAIYLWDTTKPYGKLQNSHLLKSYGDDVRKAIESKVKSEPRELQRHKDKDVRAELYFMLCDQSDECLRKVVANCMFTADENRVNSISIVLDTENSLLMTPGRMKDLCGVIKDVSITTRYLTSVVILIESDSDSARLFQDFKSVQTALSNNEDKVQITICGFEKEVTGVVDMLKVRFLPLLVDKEDNYLEPDPVQENEEDSITSHQAHLFNIMITSCRPEEEPEPVQENEEDSITSHQNAGSKTTDKGNRHIQFSKKIANYVEVLKVPKYLDKNGLKSLIFKEEKFPIPLPKLIYCKGSEKALLICQSEYDADKLAGCKDMDPFVFRKIQGEGLSSWSVQIPHKVQQLQDTEPYMKWKRELEIADIEVQTGSQPRIIVPTSYQYEYFIQSLEKFGLLFDKSSNVGATSAQHLSDEKFAPITRILDIDETVWDILIETDEYAQLKRKCATLTYKDQTILIDPGEKSLSQEIKEFEENVKSLKDKELHEIDIKPEFIAEADSWCKEISVTIGYDCCKYIRKKNKVVAFCNEYDDFARVKHILGIKTGDIKVVGKGRRRGFPIAK